MGKNFFILFILLICGNLNAQTTNNYLTPNDIFHKKPIHQPTKKKTFHNIYINPVDPFFGYISGGYELVTKKMKTGYRFPISISYQSPYFETGAGIKWYLSKNDSSSFTLGNIKLGNGFFQTYIGSSLYFIYNNKDIYSGIYGFGGIGIQFFSGLNINGYGLAGPDFLLIKNTLITNDKIFFSWSINLSVGWLLHFYKK